MNTKEEALREKFKQALESTARVISEDFKFKENNNNKSSKKFDFFQIDNLSNKSDFIKFRAEIDSAALKKKLSNESVYKKNLPNNSSRRTLYALAEKIRYETLGGKIFKGIKKNFFENYNQIISLKRKDQLKTKEDVPIVEAFELYMLKNFHKVKLNTLTSKMLSFWENELNQSISKHLKFLEDNLENQNNYSLKFSEILQQMDIFEKEENQETREENPEQDENNSSSENEQNNSDDKNEKKKEEESDVSLDADYNIDEYKIDEQLVDTD